MKLNLSEPNIESKLWITLFAVLAFFVLLSIFSCSPYKTMCTSNPELLTPNKDDYEVAWCNEQFIYVFTNPEKTEVKKIRNQDSQLIFAGDWLIEEDYLRNSYDY